MSRKLFCLFLLILSTKLFADNSLSKAEAVITSEASPNSMINGTVNAIDGIFYFSAIDLYVPGAEALHVSHSYNSKNSYAAWAGAGMSLNYSCWITGKTFRGQNKHEHGKYCYINAEAPGGSIISCVGKEKWKGTTLFYLDPALVYKGLTNCGSGEISARTNLKNCYIKEKIDSHSLISWTSHLSDGTIKEYHRTPDKEYKKNVKHEIRPNRARLDYDYYSNRSLKKITARRHCTLNWLQFHHKHNQATISTSNGKKATFKYFRKDHANYVSEITSSDVPPQKFRYTKVGNHHCINRILWPEGRFLEIEYDSKGRVTSQKAPIGKNNEKRPICSLSYHDDYTKVLDAEERKKIYRH